MLQPHAGTSYGMRFPLKPGTEVLLGFVDGDPDRPMIVGATFRPDTPSPVTSANAVINKLKSESGILIELPGW
jgi:type VI secretion system secreted protein VgrG